jgi:superfamily I DNA/RNA helicase
MVQSSIAQHQRHEKPSLQLLTVERSKGHEYEYVAVPFVNPGTSRPMRATHSATCSTSP